MHWTNDHRPRRRHETILLKPSSPPPSIALTHQQSQVRKLPNHKSCRVKLSYITVAVVRESECIKCLQCQRQQWQPRTRVCLSRVCSQAAASPERLTRSVDCHVCTDMLITPKTTHQGMESDQLELFLVLAAPTAKARSCLTVSL